ncbi:MAG: metal-dependent hydrolase [Candidatus Heimdallarchaeota archaeon]|nr:metal-dependent hydrolase [Candidatus Heimdallarchaeota archaeon]
MTWTTTHVGISNIVLYFLLPKQKRELLKSNPVSFFLVSLGSLIPDMDLFFGGHRYATHSLFVPLILLLIVQIVPIKSTDLSFYLKYFGFAWFTHMFFDMTFGPMALLWPIDDRFYDINMGILINLEGNSLLPMTIAGFFLKVIPSDPNTGTEIYFVNWSVEQRLAYFGTDQLEWGISDFIVHAVIFFWYFFFILIPAIAELHDRYLLNKFDGFSRLKQSVTKIYHKRTDWLLVFTVILLMYFSIYAGPLQDKQWIETDESTESFWILSETSKLIGMKTYTVAEQSRLEINASMYQSTTEYDFFVMQIEKNQAESIMGHISNLTQSFDNKEINQSSFILSYTTYMASVAQSIVHFDNETAVAWKFSGTTDISILFGLANWTENTSFMKSLHLSAIWYVDRTSAYIRGIYFFSFFTIFLISILFKKHLIRRFKDGALSE